MKHVVVVTGSARQGGNSDVLARAFSEGAERAGHEVVWFETKGKKLLPCAACDACFSRGKACVFNDDFNELAPALEKADTLVFATPLYWFTFPAAIKLVIDKLYAFGTGKRALPIKEAALLVCAETDAQEDFEGIIKPFELLLNYKKWKNAGILTVPGVGGIGAVRASGRSALEKAAQMGSGL